MGRKKNYPHGGARKIVQNLANNGHDRGQFELDSANTLRKSAQAETCMRGLTLR